MTQRTLTDKDLPYFTSDDESKWTGHMWRQRREIGGPWGVCFAVYPPFREEPEAVGWRSDVRSAEKAMRESLARHEGRKPA